MLHGFTDSWLSFSPVLPLLDNKSRVYILDTGHAFQWERPERFAKDLQAFIN